jgi:hypothetical protein
VCRHRKETFLVECGRYNIVCHPVLPSDVLIEILHASKMLMSTFKILE